jgi:hypothetical protein
VAAAVAFSLTDPQLLHPTVTPQLSWPQLPPGALVGLALALLPAFLTPLPPVQTEQHELAEATA